MKATRELHPFHFLMAIKGRDIREIREDLTFTQGQFAQVLRVNRETIPRGENDATAPLLFLVKPSKT